MTAAVTCALWGAGVLILWRTCSQLDWGASDVAAVGDVLLTRAAKIAILDTMLDIMAIRSFSGAECHALGRKIVYSGDSLCFDAKRSEEHTSDLQSHKRISYAVFCLKKKTKTLLYHTIN